MTIVESQRATPLTVADLAPLRRLLGSHSMVVRVNSDGTLSPFELLPQFVLGRSIRQLLVDPIRVDFEAVCLDAIQNRSARVFAHPALDGGQVFVNPVLNSDQTRCQFLVCWARNPEVPTSTSDADIGWEDLSIDDVVVRYRAIARSVVEAAPWWAIGVEGVDLWQHPQRVSAVGLASTVMTELVLEAVASAEPFGESVLRLLVPAPEMLAGMVPLCHNALAATGIDPKRVEIAVPVEQAVDADLLPLIVHLRTMGLHIDIVGLNELTSALYRVSDTAPDPETPAIAVPTVAGVWQETISAAIEDSQQLQQP